MKVEQQAAIVSRMMKLSHIVAKLGVHESDPALAAYLKVLSGQLSAHTKDLIELPCGSKNEAKI